MVAHREQPNALASAQTSSDRVMRREGDTWMFRFAGQSVRVRRVKGFDDLARLLAQPHQAIPAVDLADAHVVQRGTGPTLDGRARRAYRDRLTELERQIADARDANDPARAQLHERERDALVAELSSALGLSGRTRETSSNSERARNSVTFRIRSAIRQLERVHPRLAEHLQETIRTGHMCTYAPPPGVRWDVASTE